MRDVFMLNGTAFMGAVIVFEIAVGILVLSKAADSLAGHRTVITRAPMWSLRSNAACAAWISASG